MPGVYVHRPGAAPARNRPRGRGSSGSRRGGCGASGVGGDGLRGTGSAVDTPGPPDPRSWPQRERRVFPPAGCERFGGSKLQWRGMLPGGLGRTSVCLN